MILNLVSKEITYIFLSCLYINVDKTFEMVSSNYIIEMKKAINEKKHRFANYNNNNNNNNNNNRNVRDGKTFDFYLARMKKSFCLGASLV